MTLGQLYYHVLLSERSYLPAWADLTAQQQKRVHHAALWEQKQMSRIHQARDRNAGTIMTELRLTKEAKA